MAGRRRGLSIGVVLERLQGDFPDLTISKLRFLETEGLVTPQRAPSGYRIYSEADVSGSGRSRLSGMPWMRSTVV
jgi:hypothetical protein